METTRHYTATTYVVSEDAVALHEHGRLGKWLPPGGHVERDELPHEAALREVREETGLDVELLAPTDDIASPTVDSLPQPQHLQLADVNVHDEGVGHQHVDFVYYARASNRDVDPASGERAADAWGWFGVDELEDDRFDSDVATIGRQAIETVASQ
ncbi:NUDIX hydrolase [Halobacteriales archaeon QH_10_67_22]|nr:MAG: NUDIX hydrolase [Halobacteriales archaeon QH_10_67_22]